MNMYQYFVHIYNQKVFCSYMYFHSILFYMLCPKWMIVKTLNLGLQLYSRIASLTFEQIK